MDASASAQVREEQLFETRHPSRSMGFSGSTLAPLLHRSDCVANLCRLGSDAGRSVSPYPGSENGNTSDHNAPFPPPGPKKKGRPPKNKPRGAADVFCVVVHGKAQVAILLAPVLAASNAAAVANDDGDALSNRKRVCAISLCFHCRSPDDS